MNSGRSARKFLRFVLLSIFVAGSLSFAQTLKVATLNIWSGVDYKGTWNVREFENDSVRQKRLDLVVAELKTLQPDVVALQECNPVAAVAGEVAEALGYDFIYQRANSGIKLGPVGVPWNLNEGLALLAKKDLHLEFVDVVDLSRTLGAFGNCVSLHSSDQNIALIGSATVGATKLLLVNIHLSAAVPNEQRTRNKLTEMIQQRRIPEREQEIILTEFSEQAGVRQREAVRLREAISHHVIAAPIILLGDFNAAPEAREIEMLREQFLDCTPVSRRGEPTWDVENNPNIQHSMSLDTGRSVIECLSGWYDGISRRIDYVFLDQRFSPADVRSLDLFANEPESGLLPSDHFGLIAEIDLSRLAANPREASSASVQSPGKKFEFLPMLSYDTDVGFGYGVKAFFLDFLGESESFDVILFNSTKGERWYRLVFSVPDFELRQGKRYPLSLDLVVDYDKFTRNNFFGVGPGSRSSDRETFTKEPLEIQLVASRGFSERFVGQIGIKFKAVRNFAFDSAGLFAASAPINLGRSQGTSLYASVRYDSRNSFINPSRGNVAQLDLEGGSSGFGSDYGLFSSTVSLQTYHVLFYPKTVLAARVVGQMVGGKGLPLHTFSTLGGTKTLRGFPQDRFLDRTSVLTNIELRFPIVWRFDGLIFFDAGKLAPNIGRLALLTGWKTNPGFGLRFLMDTFIVRADLGMSKEGTGFYFNFGHLF